MPEQITRILVPIDFSVHSERALEFAIAIAERFGGIVELLHVVEDPFVSGAWSSQAFTPNIPELLDRQIAEARKRLHAITAVAAKGGGAFVTSVVTGEPSSAIVDHAKAGVFDLIVMSTQGRTGLTHLLLGSVAERVLRTARCPVLTVRAAAPRTEDARAEAATVSS
ncbi:MAG TPA: universal stress protein [Vicinamibacterales bacterium]|jgi:nucleotide-binding universal stress UspA family protein